MSCYEDIYNDFPLRCAKLWREMRESPVAKELDVTFMLMAAAAGFATPWEQLKVQPGQGASHSEQHPAFHQYDQKTYVSSLKIINTELDRFLAGSHLFDTADFDQWLKGSTPRIGNILESVEMRILPAVDIRAVKVRQVIKILRNAIAHNNIHAFARSRRGHAPDQRISELTFFSEARDSKLDASAGYDVVSMPVDDFKNFLDAWFELLKISQPKGRQLRLVVADALEEEHERAAA